MLTPLSTPTLRADRFVWEGRRSGGQGGVHVAYDLQLRRRVVARPLADAAHAFELRRRLEHPAIATALDLLVEGEESWLIEEYIAGARWDELPPATTAAWWHAAHTLLGALIALEEHDLVHRDLNAANVILRRDGAFDAAPVLIDFGLAVAKHTRVGPGGTLGTAAPEIFEGGRATPQADLFSLGALLLSAALGSAPPVRWSLENGAIEADVARVAPEQRRLLELLCASDPARRLSHAEAALEYFPRDWKPSGLPARSSWPLVGRGALLDRIAELAKKPATRPKVLLLEGADGVGKHRFAAATQREWRCAAGPRALRIENLGTMPRAGSAALEAWLRQAPTYDLAVGILEHASDREAYAAALPADQVQFLVVDALREADIRALLRQLGLANRFDARVICERAAGIAASIAILPEATGSQLDLDPAATLLTATYLLCDRTLPWPADAEDSAALRRAIALGYLETTRDGAIRATKAHASAAYLERLDDHTRAQAWAAAAKLSASGELSGAQDAAWSALLAGCVKDATNTADRWNALALEFVRSSTQPVLLERRVHLFAVMAPQTIRHALLPAFVPALRLLLGDGRSTAVEAYVATWDEPFDDALVDALRGRLAFERGDIPKACSLLAHSTKLRPQDLDLQHDLLRALQAASRWREVLICVEDLRERGFDRTPQERAILAQAQALALYRTGAPDDAVHLLYESVREFPAQPPQRLRLLALQNIGLIERYRGQLRQAEAALLEAAEGFVRLGDPRSATLVDINRAVLLQDAGQPALAESVAERAAQRAQGLGVAALASIARGTAAIAGARRAPTPRALAALRTASEELDALGLKREATVLRARALGAEIHQTGWDAEKAARLRALLQAEVIAEHPQAAAIAAVHWLEHAPATGEVPNPVTPLLRPLLRNADRATADQLRCAWDRFAWSPCEAMRRAQRLERLASRALPQLVPLAFAAAAAQGGPASPRRAAAALRALRSISDTRTAIMVWLAAARCALSAPRLRPLRRAPRELNLRFLLLRDEGPDRDMNHSSEFQRYAAELEALAENAAALARSQGSNDPTWRTLASLNALLLDERVPDETKYAQILEAAVRMTHAARGFLLVRGAHQEERIIARHGTDPDDDEADSGIEFSRSVLTRVLETGTAVRTVDAMADPQLRHALSVTRFHLSSIACVPLRSGTKILGALYLDHPHERSVFGPEIMERLATLADQASLSLAATQQREQIQRLNEQLERDLSAARAEVAVARGARTIVHQSAIMRSLLARAERIAVSELPALVRGETGTGKELIARRLHDLSPRRDGPFVSENCSAIAGELLESELFGHEKGAFTGAMRDKPGLLRMADGGTLFLDEIGDMPVELQTRLLRVLQEGRMRPVGADREQKIDVRLITATHRDLEQMVREERFREDLYYRIRVAELSVPSLRERREDIPLLVDAFLQRDGAQATISPAALEVLKRYSWPGNVRELEGVIRSVLVLKQGTRIEVEDLPAELRGNLYASSGALPSLQLKELERLALIEALKQVDGNRVRAAEMLGISRSSVFNKLREHGLS